MSSLTGNMGLTIWNNIDDDFDFGVLEDNFLAIDQHDHSDEMGVQIGTEGLRDQVVISSKLAPLAVATSHIQSAAVTGSQIAERAITGDKIQPYAITPGLVENLSLTYGQMDPTLVPLGGIMLWWRPPGSGAAPGGVWEIMDGRPWNSISNAWGLNSGNIPNMIDSFVMGTGTTTGVGIGNTGGAGGSINLSHAHNVLAHAHTTPAHAHGIAPDGSHAHTFFGGLNTWARQNVIDVNIAYLSGWPNSNKVDVSSYSMYLAGLTNNPAFQVQGYGATNDPQNGAIPMDDAGEHSHFGFTGNGGNGVTGPAESSTDAQLGDVDVTPPYVGLVYMMKCRQQ
jgi:hypothetical protein